MIDLLKKIYELKKCHNLPNHIAIIMDGNRRHAINNNLNKIEGHGIAIKMMKNVLFPTLFDKLKIPVKEFSFFALSYDNYYKRTKEEIYTLMNHIKDFIPNFAKSELVKKCGIKINIIGDIELLDKDIQEVLKNSEEETKNNNNYILNFLIMYDGQKEIINATKKIVKDSIENKINIADIDSDLIRSYCVTSRTSKPDLIIRTSNEQRLSGFFLFDSYYSEFIFLEKNWPEVNANDLIDCIIEYTKRDIRNGK